MIKEVSPSQKVEEYDTTAKATFYIRCADVGLNCKCLIYGTSENNIIHSTVAHMYEYHAIKPDEMTACMKIKINRNIHTSLFVLD